VENCPRCYRGQIMSSYGIRFCLQCGYDPDALIRAIEEVEPLREFRFRENLSAKPSQIRRRRKRLSAAGYSEIEIERIMRVQLGSAQL